MRAELRRRSRLLRRRWSKSSPHDKTLQVWSFLPLLFFGYSSPMLNSNGITQSQRTASTGNIDSTSIKSGNSSLADLFFDPENVHRTQESNNFVAPSFVAFSDAVKGAEEDLFSRPNLQQQHATGLYPFVDFFANMPPTTPSADKLSVEAPSMDNAGWATLTHLQKINRLESPGPLL